MFKLIKHAGMFLGLMALTLLSLSIGFGRISLPPQETATGLDDAPRVGTTTVTLPENPPAPSKEVPEKKASIPAPLPKKQPISTTAKITAPPVVSSPSPKPSISVPGPLIAPNPPPSDAGAGISEDGALNPKDIITLTNNERVKEGEGALALSSQLTAMAQAKALDMINKQYFAHVSPDGTDVTKLAERVHYEYLNVGENLALGDFRSSEDVVQGWMNSPGHRANILNKSFTEIGVSAVIGKYEGRMVWYSVQEFGRPMPLCPKPDTVLEQKIALYETQVAATEQTLKNLRAEIDAPDIPRETYDIKAKDYNTLVGFYNGLLATLKADIAVYNAGAKAYNTCIGSEA